MVHRNTKHLEQIFSGNFLVKSLFGHHLLGAETHHVADATFQVTHTRLTGVVVDDVHHNILREGNLFAVQAVFLHLLWNEMPLGDFIFLLTQITTQVDDLHTVAQGGMNRRKVVGRGDEEDFREVVVQLDEIVVEGIILLRVKDFQKRSLRVAADVVATYLVDFVQDKNGISRLHLTQILDNSARHSTDISLSMTTQFRLIAHAAQ